MVTHPFSYPFFSSPFHPLILPLPLTPTPPASHHRAAVANHHIATATILPQPTPLLSQSPPTSPASPSRRHRELPAANRRPTSRSPHPKHRTTLTQTSPPPNNFPTNHLAPSPAAAYCHSCQPSPACQLPRFSLPSRAR
ncbi:hypothetical protein AKJ16_DCAP12090 [Drosera capensis]